MAQLRWELSLGTPRVAVESEVLDEPAGALRGNRA